MNVTLLILLPFLFAFLYRCRGGFLGLGSTQAARLLWWGLPVTAWAVSIEPLWGLLSGLMAFLGLIIIPHAVFQAEASLKNLLGMGAVCTARLSLILAPLAYFHPAILYALPLGLLGGPAYYFAWKYLSTAKLFTGFPGFRIGNWQVFQPGDFAIGGSAFGEVNTGAVFGLAFSTIKIIVGA